LWKEFKLEKVN